MSKSKTNSQGYYTRKHQAHPNAGKSFHPRSLFRGLSVPYSKKPGQKYLYPQLRDKDGRQIMTIKEYKKRMHAARVAHEQS